MAVSGSIAKVGDKVTYAYAGVVESFVAPFDGIYKLECYGAQGASDSKCTGGKGGYSVGYKLLKKGTNIYICVGGQSGYNGGGSGGTYNSDRYGLYGGDATHIASVSGTLKSIGVSNLSKIYIIAGGGGGGSYDKKTYNGGTGGGTSGGYGAYDGGSYISEPPGTQTSGYAFGQGEPTGSRLRAGGGSGLYGGGRSGSGGYSGGSGGSGYIDGVPSFTHRGITYSPSTTNGQRSGNGMAIITLMEFDKITNLYYNGVQVQRVFLDNVEINKIYNGDIQIFG